MLNHRRICQCISIHALREEGDLCGVLGFHGLSISIHALREEGDQSDELSVAVKSDFYPRPPRGGRPVFVKEICTTQAISIHALREEGDSHRSSSLTVAVISIHALREEGDLFSSTGGRTPGNFYPRPPRGGRLSSLMNA